MELKIALLPGDGIGPEIVGEAVKVLDRVAAKYGHVFKYEKALVGACAIDATGDPYPAETHAVCLRSDAVLFGAIGDPKYDNDPSAKVRPEQGLLRMRKSLGLYANLRPLAVFDSLAGRSPLKTEIVRGADFLCVRELTGGMYFGRPQGRSEDGNTAYDTCVYTREEIERILRLAFELARKRRKHLTVVDKANVIATSRLWRQIAGEMALLLPFVMEYNKEAAKAKYRTIAEAMGVDTSSMSDDEAADAAVKAVKDLAIRVRIPQHLSEIGVPESGLPTLAQAAFNDVCTPGNPRQTNVEEILAIYKKAF